jgi:HemY protein
MKKLFLILLTISLAVATVWFLVQDTGFVVLGYGHWTLETSLSFFILLFLLSFFVLSLLLRLLSLLWHFGDYWRSRQQQKHEQKKYTRLVQGLAWLVEGQWTKAEKSLLQHPPETVHLLAAAYGAQQQQLLPQRDQHLQAALATQQYEIAVKLWQTQLQLAQNQDNDALATISALQQQYPQHPQVLDLLSQVYFQRQQWLALWQLLPLLRKHTPLNQAQIQTLEVETVQGLLTQDQALPFVWQKLPKNLRLLPAVCRTYVNFLLRQQQVQAAEAVLRETLESDWHSDLLPLYSKIEFDLAQQLHHAEKWIRKHYNDPQLLLCLGRLSMKNRLWGKAQQYLESSLNLQKSPQCHQALAELMVQMGEINQAVAYYQQACPSD